MQFKYISILFGAWALTACGAVSKLPQVDDAAAKQEAEIQKEMALNSAAQYRKRLNDVSYGLLTSNSKECPEQRFSAGIQYYYFNDKNQNIARRVFNMTDAPYIFSVAKNSSAAKAGIQIGDEIVAFNETRAPNDDHREFAKSLNDAIKETKSGKIKLTLRSGGTERDVAVSLDLVCDMPIVFQHKDVVNAFADGSNVMVSKGMMRFVENDDELALIIGHEMAHNTMGHLRKQQGNSLLGALVDGVIGAVTGVNLGLFQQAGANAFSQDFEAESDYVGAYYAARAGYDVSGAVYLWRRMGADNPAAIHLAGTSHPSTAKRLLALKKTQEEIEAKRAAGLPLLPDRENSNKVTINENPARVITE